MRNIDQRIIYVLIFVSVVLPLRAGLRLPAARLSAADEAFAIVESLKPRQGTFAFVAFDFGPSSNAENGPQAEVILEHLMRRRIPVLLMTQYAQGEGFLESIPAANAGKLKKENPGERWEYGRDWVSIGYRTGPTLFIQALAKSEDIVSYIGKDARGTELRSIPMMDGVKTIKDAVALVQLTGLMGTFDTYVQFFQRADYVPTFIHGCTSITIPEAYIYRDSGQLKGLLEGVSGAAWYSELMRKQFPQREDDSSRAINTALGFSQLTILALVLLGNLPRLVNTLRRRLA
jgi:hypothetical protein